uniref:Uncharacterized protein n=1 Tax=Meloidogyne javanica TaxID=6303 RepID=A0A915M603_MELJA
MKIWIGKKKKENQLVNGRRRSGLDRLELGDWKVDGKKSKIRDLKKIWSNCVSNLETKKVLIEKENQTDCGVSEEDLPLDCGVSEEDLPLDCGVSEEDLPLDCGVSEEDLPLDCGRRQKVNQKMKGRESGLSKLELNR